MKMKRIVKLLLKLFLCITVSNSAYAQQVNIRCFFNGFYCDGCTTQLVPIVDPINSPTIFDTIRIDFVDPLYGTIRYSTYGIDSTNGWLSITVPSFLVNTTNYISIKQRSCLKTWSDTFITIDPVLTVFDFTTAATQSYGSNELTNATGAASIYAGDFNNDGLIDSLDFNIYANDNIHFLNGPYLIDDLNGDQNVDIYEFPILDISFKDSAHEQKPVFMTVSVQDINNKNQIIKITPNPANDLIVIENNTKNITNCSIYNQQGQLVYTNGDVVTQLKVNTTTFSSGVYSVRIVADNKKTVSQSFIIQH